MDFFQTQAQFQIQLVICVMQDLVLFFKEVRYKLLRVAIDLYLKCLSHASHLR